MLAVRYLRYGLLRWVGFAAIAGFGLIPNSASGQIYNWQTGQVIPGTEGIASGQYMDLQNWDTAGHTLEYAELGNLDLSYSTFSLCDLTSADFSATNLTETSFDGTLTSVNFSNANLTYATLGGIIANANFAGATLYHTSFTGFYTYDPSHELTQSQLYSTASYQSQSLAQMNFIYENFAGWNFTNQNLSNSTFEFTSVSGASFHNANLSYVQFDGADVSGADFTGAIINGSDLADNVGYLNERSGSPGFTSAQLYSTASYSSQNLSNIAFSYDNLNGWNFANQNLSGSNLEQSTLFGANLSNANLTGASLFDTDFRGAIGTPASGVPYGYDIILPDGTLPSLAMSEGEVLTIRNNPVPVTVTGEASFYKLATIRFLLDNNWTSPVGFAPGVLPNLAGSLDLEFASDVDPATLIGDTFQLFNYSNPLQEGDQFNVVTSASGYLWDTSQLYIDGTVILLAIPEPATASLLVVAAIVFIGRRHK